MLNYRILLRKESEGGYTVTAPSLPGCITYGETIEKAIEMAKEAIELYIESLKEHGEEIPTEEESFSDVIKKRVKKRKSNLSDYFGALKDSKVIGEIEKDSNRIRDAAMIRI